jgi:hypothetical protein
VKLRFDDLVREYLELLRRNFPEARVDLHNEPLEAVLQSFEPLVSPMTRELLVSTDSGWTAIFGNSVGLSDCFTVSAMCARFLSVDAFAVVYAPDRMDQVRDGAVNVYRSMQFQYYSARAEEPTRTIVSSNDGGRWVFIDQGKPFEFEDAAKYLSKRVRDRIGPQDIEAVCNCFGVSLAKGDCFGSRSAMVTRNRPIPNARVMAYSEAQRALGITIA